MKSKTPNRFDTLVDRLIKEFVTIPNFDLVNKDAVANKVFNIISLLLLIYYIFAIMGYHFFKNITFYVAINEYKIK